MKITKKQLILSNKRILSDKKAQSFFEIGHKTIFFTVIIFVLFILLGTFFFLLDSYERGLTSVPDKLKAELVSLRFTNEPECFAYQDPETGRIFPGIIDLNKFNERQMSVCYKTNEQTGKNEFNFRLQLESDLSQSVKTNKYFNVDTFTIVKDVVVKRPDQSKPRDQFKKDKLFIYVQAGLIS